MEGVLVKACIRGALYHCKEVTIASSICLSCFAALPALLILYDSLNCFSSMLFSASLNWLVGAISKRTAHRVSCWFKFASNVSNLDIKYAHEAMGYPLFPILDRIDTIHLIEVGRAVDINKRGKVAGWL